MKIIENFESFNQIEEKKEDTCWTGYKQVGTKKKDGKEVPNCVPDPKNKIEKSDSKKKKNEHLLSFDDFNLIEEKKDSRLVNAGVSGFNKPKRTPSHPKKSHIVVAKEGDKVKTIRFGEQGAETAGKPKKGESKRMKMKRKSFKARHAKNIKKGKMSAAYWADKVKW